MDEVSIEIAKPRAEVWDLIADFNNMGRWSPELVKITWVGDESDPAVGAKFKGRNKHGFMQWSTTSTITQCEVGKVIEWEVNDSSTRWGFRFEDAAGGGTTVTEYREKYKDTMLLAKVVQRSGLLGRGREDLMRSGMRTTLQRVKAAAEG